MMNIIKQIGDETLPLNTEVLLFERDCPRHTKIVVFLGITKFRPCTAAAKTLGDEIKKWWYK